jgi:hypothetical protein
VIQYHQATNLTDRLKTQEAQSTSHRWAFRFSTNECLFYFITNALATQLACDHIADATSHDKHRLTVSHRQTQEAQVCHMPNNERQATNALASSFLTPLEISNRIGLLATPLVTSTWVCSQRTQVFLCNHTTFFCAVRFFLCPFPLLPSTSPRI